MLLWPAHFLPAAEQSNILPLLKRLKSSFSSTSISSLSPTSLDCVWIKERVDKVGMWGDRVDCAWRMAATGLNFWARYMIDHWHISRFRSVTVSAIRAILVSGKVRPLICKAIMLTQWPQHILMLSFLSSEHRHMNRWRDCPAASKQPLNWPTQSLGVAVD